MIKQKITPYTTSERYEFLMRDRCPSAFSTLSLIKGNSSAGKIEFYTTPLGTLVHAELTGMPPNNGDGYDAYFLEIEGKRNKSCIKSHASYRARTSNLPPVFTRCGRGSISFMTDSFSVFDLIGRNIFLMQNGQSIAYGEILVCGND